LANLEKTEDLEGLSEIRAETKSRIIGDIGRNKAGLDVRLRRVKDRADLAYYKRKMDQVYNYIEENCFPHGDRHFILDMADFYQKIEVFMKYDKEKYNESEIYNLIAEVFKSYYINFILYFLDAKRGERFPVPYIGDYKLKHKKLQVNSPLKSKKKHIHQFYGVIRMFKNVKDEIRRILDGDDSILADEAMEEIRETVEEML